jgi:hypothetical protein
MSLQNISWVSGSNSRNPRTYLLIGLSVVTGAFFFIQWQLNYTPPEGLAICALVSLVLGVPAVMGYTGYSFIESAVVGMLPWLGLRVGGWVQPPVTIFTIENMVKAFVLSAGTVLPVVALSFGFGLALRDRDALKNQARPLAFRVAATVLLLAVVVVATEMGFLEVDMVQ